MKQKALIIGAGPAGLTAASELLARTDVTPVVCEATDTIGGIARTIEHHGNRIDIGGHRFFSKDERIMRWWTDRMPLQGAPACDDRMLGETGKPFVEGGPDPEREERVMLVRRRISRIYYLKKFFDYPITLKWEVFANMGLRRTTAAGCGYLRSLLVKRPENSLEDFYINRFGKPLYRLFFEDYTEKVWGVHPSRLGADWGAQRVKGLSLWAVIRDIARKPFRRNGDLAQQEVETSLIEQFIYPKRGPGQLWETVADDIRKQGAILHLERKVSHIRLAGNRVVSVETETPTGERHTETCNHLLSSMPIRDLVAAMGEAVPADVREIAAGLAYRDFITVGLLVKDLKIKNRTRLKTVGDRIPDTWIYVQEREVRMGRLQVFNNWSPYLVNDFENSVWIGLEYFCNEGDALWNLDDDSFIAMAVNELVRLGMIDPDDVLDSLRIRMPKAYPAYYGSYYRLDRVRKFLDGIENLYCIGRNGQHRYNNMDHSMLSAMEAVANIRDGIVTKENVWAVNTENEYHETKTNR